MTTTLYRESGHDGLFDMAEVARGNVYGAIPFGSYGEKVTIGADSGLLWPNGAFIYPPTAGVQVSVASTSASDGVAGVGIQSVDIHYLDASLVSKTETVLMNGIIPVLSIATDIRFIQCVHAVTFGSSKSAVGSISVYNGANTYSYISIGDLRCSSSLRMVPAGKRLLVTSMYAGSVSGTAAASATIKIVSPSFDGHDFTQSNIMMPLFSAAFQDSSSGLSLPCPLVFTEGQSIGMTFKCDKAATVVGSWFGVLEDV
jgi:hypothetical protein